MSGNKGEAIVHQEVTLRLSSFSKGFRLGELWLRFMFELYNCELYE